MGTLIWNKDFALEQTAGDEELLEELMLLFKKSSAGDLETLKQAVSHDDSANVVSAAHSLKGSAASLGVDSVFELAKEMEEDGLDGSVAKARDGLGGMETMLEEMNRL